MHKICLKQDNSDNGLIIAKYFKYFRQETNANIVRPLPFERISAKTFYLEHKYQFNKFAEICKKYSINHENFIEYFVCFLKKTEKDIDSHLLNPYTFQLYSEYLALKQKYKNIIKYVQKSAKNIADECILYGYPHSVDYFRFLIQSRKLAQYYISGKISKYFLAAIPNFPKIITKLDPISQDEFSVIYERFELYNIDLNQALKRHKIHIRNIFNYVDDMIKNINNI